MKKTDLLTSETKAVIDHWVAKFPPEQKRSALLQALTATQKQNNGWLSSELMDAVAEYLDIPRVWAYEVATFYDMYDLKPCGKHKIRVCTNVSCMLRGSDKIVEYLQNKLGIKQGETTEDGLFTLKESECLAACSNAPMMQIDLGYYTDLTPEKIDAVIEKVRSEEGDAE